MKFRIHRNWRWLVALGAILVPGIVAGAFNVPHTFTAGTPIKASEMNANFDALAAKLDALNNPPAPVSVGTLTLENVATDLPISKFSQSIQVTWVPPTAPSKPKFSEIVVTRDAGASTPQLNLRASQGSLVPSASIVLGNLTVALGQVHIVGMGVAEPRGGLPQESITLTFTSISWTWSDGVNPSRQMSYDIAKGTGGSGAVKAFNFGYFPPGVTPDPAYVPISSYSQQSACAVPGPGCKLIHGPLSVKKLVGVDTLDEIGGSVVAKQCSAELSWFKDETTINNSVSLPQALVTGLAISTGDDGSLNETTSLTYSQVSWKAGIVEAGWDVVANAPL